MSDVTINVKCHIPFREEADRTKQPWGWGSEWWFGLVERDAGQPSAAPLRTPPPGALAPYSPSSSTCEYCWCRLHQMVGNGTLAVLRSGNRCHLPDLAVSFFEALNVGEGRHSPISSCFAGRMKRFGRRRTRHEETHQNPISFVTHSLTVQHHGGPSALRRRITIFSYQIRIHYHVWM